MSRAPAHRWPGRALQHLKSSVIDADDHLDAMWRRFDARLGRGKPRHLAAYRGFADENGVELIGRIGQPHLGRHSLQIEIRRPVYMDEDTRAPNAGFVPLQQHLDQVLATVAGYVRSQLQK